MAHFNPISYDGVLPAIALSSLVLNTRDKGSSHNSGIFVCVCLPSLPHNSYLHSAGPF